MAIKKKTTNSLTELLEKSKGLAINMAATKHVYQEPVDEKKILRPYLDPENSLIEKISFIEKQNETASEQLEQSEHITDTYRAHNGHEKDTKKERSEHITDTYRARKRAQSKLS